MCVCQRRLQMSCGAHVRNVRLLPRSTGAEAPSARVPITHFPFPTVFVVRACSQRRGVGLAEPLPGDLTLTTALWGTFAALDRFGLLLLLNVFQHSAKALVRNDVGLLDLADLIEERIGQIHPFVLGVGQAVVSPAAISLKGGVSPNPRFFRRSNLSGLRCFGWPDLCPFRPDLAVIDVKIFPLFDSITESFGEKQAKSGLTEFSGVWAYNPRKEKTPCIIRAPGSISTISTPCPPAASPRRSNLPQGLPGLWPRTWPASTGNGPLLATISSASGQGTSCGPVAALPPA